jgi:hypothetical protein
MNAWSRTLLSLAVVPVALGVAASALAAGAAPPVAAGPTIGEVLDSSAMSNLAGDWAEYARVEGTKINYADTFRMSFLAGADGKGAWAELWLGKTGEVSMRFRKVGDATEVFFKMQGSIYRIDDPKVGEKLACAGGSCAAKDGKPSPNKAIVGQETLRTVAGSFKCTKVRTRSPQGETLLWTTAEVPALHLAKVITPMGFGYELVAFGKNATSAFPAHFSANPLPLQHLAALEAITPDMEGRATPACDPKKGPCPDAGVAAGPPDAGLPPLRPYQPRVDAGK